MVEFMQEGTTIAPEIYCEEKELRRAIRNTRLASGVLVVLLYDNEHQHTAVSTRNTAGEFQLGVV
jgi:hypothetical protein